MGLLAQKHVIIVVSCSRAAETSRCFLLKAQFPNRPHTSLFSTLLHAARVPRGSHQCSSEPVALLLQRHHIHWFAIVDVFGLIQIRFGS